MKRMLVLLLILLKEAGPTAAHSCSCSSRCDCSSRGLSSVPQDLPTSITSLTLSGNYITILSHSDFSRYSSLTRLYLHNNQISVINSGAFYNLTRVTTLYLSYNRLTSLRSDMFVGNDSLRYLYLHDNNVHSIEAGTFNSTPQLRTLQLQYNNISTIAAGTFANMPVLRYIDLSYNGIKTFPVESLSNLNTTTILASNPWFGSLRLTLNFNQMETLPPAAYDILASMSKRTVTVAIDNNPWQCDCRMLPFKQKMTGFQNFEKQIRCAGPERLEGKGLLLSVNPEDLNCDETGSTDSTTPASFSLSAFLSGVLGGVLGSFLISAIFLATWCLKKRAQNEPCAGPQRCYQQSERRRYRPDRRPSHGSGHHTSYRFRAGHTDGVESRPRTSGMVPPPRSVDKGFAVLRAPLH
ncbi:hypothetical protein Bbelb_332960 [Branchiostoma belcheri]|nr:hypothetical protein Bbelb_332960 [Branchiostoma belcheri]